MSEPSIIMDLLDFVKANPVATWAAIVSTGLAMIKIWETFWRDRIRLDSTYLLTDERDVPNEVVIANLSPVPVQIAHWELAWEARWFAFWLKKEDVSPDEPTRFKINGRDEHTIRYEFQWNGAASSGRRLVLRLKAFGQRRQIKLVIAPGTQPDWVWSIRKRLPRLHRERDLDL